MKELKEALKNLWKAFIKLVLSKTSIDEKITDKVEKLHDDMESIDKIDNDTENEVKPKTKK
jgi:hypothetical protein